VNFRNRGSDLDRRFFLAVRTFWGSKSPIMSFVEPEQSMSSFASTQLKIEMRGVTTTLSAALMKTSRKTLEALFAILLMVFAISRSSLWSSLSYLVKESLSPHYK